MGIAENIKRLRTEHEWTQEQLAKKVNVTRATVTQWETGWSQPRMGAVQRLAGAFNVSVSEIVDNVRGSGFVPVPLYGSVAAGVPIEMIPVENTKEAPARYVDDDPNAYLVRVKGNSMSRRMQDTDFALVSPKYTEPNEHDMFLVTVNGDDATIKKVRVLENGVELVPDSYDPTFRPVTIDFGEENAPPVRILGKIVWWCSSF